MPMFCFHEPILQKEMFFCVLRLFLRNSLRGAGSGLAAANGICMETASPTNNSTEGSQPSSFLIPLGRNSHPLFPAVCLLPFVSVSCLGCFYCRHAGSFAGAQPPVPFFPCALSYGNFIDSQGLNHLLYRQF